MHKQIKGVFRNGKVELTGDVPPADGTPVVVTILDQTTVAPRPHRPITRGMFAKRDGTGLSDQDVKDMKRIWEREWERSWERLENS